MKKYTELRGKQRRNHQRFLSWVRQKGVVYIRYSHQFRIADRLRKAKLITACVSKINLLGPFTSYPFRELAVFASEQKALQQYVYMLPRK